MSTTKDDNDGTATSTAITLSQVTADTAAAETTTVPTPIYKYWDGVLPSATGPVSSKLAAQSLAEQHRNAYKLYKLMYSFDIDDRLLELNEMPPLTTCIFHLPGNQRKIRVLHSIGAGLAPAKAATLESRARILGLTGESIPDLLPPQVLSLDPTVLCPTEYPVPMEAPFDVALSAFDPAKDKDYLFVASKLDTKFVGRQLMPITPCFVLDAIDSDIDTFVLYERIKAQLGPDDDDHSKLLEKVLEFLRAGPLSLTKNHNDISLPLSTLLAAPDIAALKWRQRRVAQLYPALPPPPQSDAPAAPTTMRAAETIIIDDTTPSTTTSTTIPATASTTTAPTGTAPTSTPAATTASATAAPATTEASSTSSTSAFTRRGKVIEMSESTLLEIFKEMKDAVRSSTSRLSTSGSSEDDDEESPTLGLAPSAYNTLLTQCGLAASLADELPPLWKKLAEKKLTKSDKSRIIQVEINKNVRYRSNKVPTLTSIYNMVMERKFEGEQVPSSLLSAVKGLSPFAVPRLSNAEVDQRNALEEDLAVATSTSVKDLAGTKLQCSAPDTFEGLCQQLKRFCNLCYACFGDSSPLVIALGDLIDDLEDYNDLEQANMSKRTIATILWIVLLQSRHFAAGLMTGDTPNTMAFQHMLMAIHSRMPIIHTGVPSSLYVTPAKDTSSKHQLDFVSDHSLSKRLKSEPSAPSTSKLQDRSAVVHESMKRAMAAFVAMTPRPSIRHLCQAAGTSTTDLFPATPNLCLKAQLWGKCDKFCKFDHIRVPQEAITKALAALKPVIEKPESVKKVN